MRHNFKKTKRSISQLYLFFAITFMLSSYTAIGQNIKADFFVATNGNDKWSGTLDSPNKANNDGPFATLERARDAVRELKDTENKKDISVLIRGGRYYLSQTVLFGLNDAASEGLTITYQKLD